MRIKQLPQPNSVQELNDSERRFYYYYHTILQDNAELTIATPELATLSAGCIHADSEDGVKQIPTDERFFGTIRALDFYLTDRGYRRVQLGEVGLYLDAKRGCRAFCCLILRHCKLPRWWQYPRVLLWCWIQGRKLRKKTDGEILTQERS